MNASACSLLLLLLLLPTAPCLWLLVRSSSSLTAILNMISDINGGFTCKRVKHGNVRAVIAYLITAGARFKIKKATNAAEGRIRVGV